jgi:NADH:ubiquinone oxidoreductase subunit 6 (subunit J)
MPLSNAYRAIVWAIGVLPLIVFAALYSRLPASVAMQWRLDGKPTWHAPKFAYGAGLAIELALILLLTTSGTVQRRNVERLGRAFPAAMLVVFALLSAALIAGVIANLPP